MAHDSPPLRTNPDRLSRRFAAVKEAKRTALVTFIMSHDPDLTTSSRMLAELPAAGADVIELGMPFSDPMADGKAIQDAGQRALLAGATLKVTLAQVKAFREREKETPLVLMGYLNPVEYYGYDRFFADAADAGVDGMILVDLPPEEDASVRAVAVRHGIDMVRLVAPTTLGGRLETVLEHARGFVYTVAVAGITGDKSADVDMLARQVQAIRRHSDLPVAAGFGIRTPAQAREIATHSGADAIVVGSAIVDALAHQGVEDALGLVQELAQALRD